MIITVRGTHGSGKSHLVRSVRDKYPTVLPDFEGWRDRPFGYLCTGGGDRPLWIPGSYENTCGGCDSISDINEAFQSIIDHTEMSHDVLYEGIVAQHSRWNFEELELAFGRQAIKVIVLTTPLEDCIKAVDSRRSERGKGRLEDPKNIRSEARGVELAARKLEVKGVDVRYLDRDMALEVILKELGWS